VATTITYTRSFSYSIDQFSGEAFPGLEVRLSLPSGGADNAVDLIAHLDSGAMRSVFDGGRIVSILGIDLMAGREIKLGFINGFNFSARIHRVQLSHPLLGQFTLDAAISTVPIRRNLLGRDFFRHLQIGFREFHQNFLITAAP
jgi:hypothetical protein